jgi:hypothetical protein
MIGTQLRHYLIEETFGLEEHWSRGGRQGLGAE